MIHYYIYTVLYNIISPVVRNLNVNREENYFSLLAKNQPATIIRQWKVFIWSVIIQYLINIFKFDPVKLTSLEFYWVCRYVSAVYLYVYVIILCGARERRRRCFMNRLGLTVICVISQQICIILNSSASVWVINVNITVWYMTWAFSVNV